jgi:hypothetical protein
MMTPLDRDHVKRLAKRRERVGGARIVQREILGQTNGNNSIITALKHILQH